MTSPLFVVLLPKITAVSQIAIEYVLISIFDNTIAQKCVVMNFVTNVC